MAVFALEPVACWTTRFTGKPLTQTASLTAAFANTLYHAHHPVLLSTQRLGAFKDKLYLFKVTGMEDAYNQKQICHAHHLRKSLGRIQLLFLPHLTSV